jgi:hypothetical protein
LNPVEAEDELPVLKLVVAGAAVFHDVIDGAAELAASTAGAAELVVLKLGAAEAPVFQDDVEGVALKVLDEPELPVFQDVEGAAELPVL